MTSLIDLGLKNVYRTGKDDLLQDFYIPALKTAKNYDRAVGYFSTSLISYALKGISEIVKNDGNIRLIVGYPLDEEEFDALKEGIQLRNIGLMLKSEFEKIIESSTTKIEKFRLQLFIMLVAMNKLEMKFAFKPKGMYHEKIGIIKDKHNNKILFHGSANETTNAINPDLNFESIAVYKSWDSKVYDEYASSFEQGFEDLWNGRESNIFIVNMPSDLYEKIISIYKKNSRIDIDNAINELDLLSELNETKINHYPLVPHNINGQKFEIYEHQSQALKSWFANGHKGLFRLATGSGKTITAMYGVAKIFEKARSPRKMVLIVAVPYQALAEQWVKELSLFNMKPIKCFYSKNKWQDKLNTSINLLKNGQIEFFSLVVVNKTLTSPEFESSINRLDNDSIFFVGDECHRHANENIINCLPKAGFRMGLSATPFIEDDEFEFDGPNTEKEILTSYYGNVIAEYTLAQALAEGILTPYKYMIITVELTEQESESYLKLSKEIARLFAIDSSKDNKALSNIIRKRNNIISNTEEKQKSLYKLLNSIKFEDKTHTLFYVGEGSSIVDKDISISIEEDFSQLEVVAKVIMNNGWRLSKFTSLESKEDRSAIMDSFVTGTIDALVSMRVLDEGIDIPQCKRAFILASSRNSRQFIQRRGRILRRSEGKDYAEIYDFVVLPNKNLTFNDHSKKLVSREMTRVFEFLRLSDNRSENEEEYKNIIEKYNIH